MAGNSVQLTGDWDRLKRILEQASPNLKKESRRTIGQQLKKIEATVLGHLDKQDLEWMPLSEAYFDKKEYDGLSPDILRATSRMYENITTHQLDDFTGACGVKRGVLTKDGQEETDIALIHEQPENDSGEIKKIPPRKLWKPTFEELKPGLERELKEIAIEVFKK